MVQFGEVYPRGNGGTRKTVPIPTSVGRTGLSGSISVCPLDAPRGRVV